MNICNGYEKDCSCEQCHDLRCESVRQQSQQLAKLLKEHLEKIEKSDQQISIQPERSKREDISFFKKLMMRCSEHYRNIVRGK